MKRDYKYRLNAVSTVAGEMVKGHGEDSYSYSFTDKKGFIGVFDGCGGVGGKRYEVFDNYTGAYIASRVSAVSALDWWKKEGIRGGSVDALKSLISKRLKNLKNGSGSASDGVGLKGSLSKKDFPTTACMVSFDFVKTPVCEFLWAGDSRGYILDKIGLSQVTKDDVDAVVDAYSNIESDARVTNVINSDVDFYLNQRGIALSDPAVLIVSTDGCFSYYETPMEFEYLILSTLYKSKSISEWEIRLDTALKYQASDDYTLGLAVCGFRRFKDIKEYFRKRYELLKTKYIDKISELRLNGQEADLTMLWQDYKDVYYRYEK